MAEPTRVVLFSGGGTAGHLAPGFALARALEARGAVPVFATPGEDVEQAWFAGRPPPRRLPAPRLPRGLARSLAFPFRMARAVWSARRLLRRERAACVVALGGWPCAPAAIAARWKRVPLVFLVPDAVPGLVVRKLARWAGRIYVAEPGAAQALGGGESVRHTGPLLRDAVSEGRRDPTAFGLWPDRRTLFVTGGSLGASGLNERFLAGLEQAVRDDPGLAGRVQVLHSTGEGAADVARRYEALGVTHRVTPFVQAMADAYATADLVLARAGANTCAELAATRTPAVFVPYPHHADRQQFRNAEPLVASGAARLVEEGELTPERVRGDVLDLLHDDAALDAMRAAGGAAPSDAAAETAEDLVRFLGWDAPVRDASAP
jgi:UDP-N-acetylglucosamine--N-acetylmuramyl-(pentapeptide) pyrophosphoryl-undecaprenol N-acetylglucosamine transferase